MNTPLWVVDLATEFWSLAGAPGPLPRSLQDAAERTGLLTVEALPRLTLHDVVARLARVGVTCPAPAANRALHACLVARGGAGFVFVNAADSADEQRFSIAHEIAHFLRDYWQPRREAQRRLGPTALEVLDGGRAPRPEERLHSLFARLRLGFFTHLMSVRAGDADETIAHIEAEADRLAWELLAPAHLVLNEETNDRKTVEKRLLVTCGLPAAQARNYAHLLVPTPPPRNSLLVRLFSDAP